MIAYAITDIGVGKDRKIDVKQFTSFVSMDGEPWFAKKRIRVRGSTRHPANDFLKIKREDWQIICREPIKEVALCSAIATSKEVEAYIPMLFNLSDTTSMPIVFNNACLSLHNLSSVFLFAGASSYIGTLKPVWNFDAVEVASKFFDKCIDEGKPALLALWEAQNEVYGSDRDHIYIHMGCHFNRFKVAVGDNKTRVLERIANAEDRWVQVISRSKKEGVVTNSANALSFLEGKSIELLKH